MLNKMYLYFRSHESLLSAHSPAVSTMDLGPPHQVSWKKETIPISQFDYEITFSSIFVTVFQSIYYSLFLVSKTHVKFLQ